MLVHLELLHVRFGHFLAPLDEALVQVALDCSGRPHLSFGLTIPAQKIGSYDTELVKEFFVAVVNNRPEGEAMFGQPRTAGAALRLARFFGTTAQYWMDLQTAYDLRVAEEQAGEQVRREITPVKVGANGMALAA